MFRLPIARSAALVSATVATRGITQQQGARPQSDQKSDGKGKLPSLVKDKEKPMMDVWENDGGQQNETPKTQMSSDKSREGTR
jgi:hypothetical protein